MSREEVVTIFIGAWADYDRILEAKAEELRKDLPSDVGQLTRVQRIGSDLQSADWRKTVAMSLAMLEGLHGGGMLAGAAAETVSAGRLGSTSP